MKPDKVLDTLNLSPDTQITQEVLDNYNQKVRELEYQREIESLQTDVIQKMQQIVTKLKKSIDCYPKDTQLTQWFFEDILTIEGFLTEKDLIHEMLISINPDDRQIDSILNKLNNIEETTLDAIDITELNLNDIEFPSEPLVSNSNQLLTHTSKSTNKTTSSKKNTQQIEGNTQEDQSIKQFLQLLVSLGALAAMFVISEQNKKMHQPVRIASPVEVIIQNRSAKPDESKFGRLDNIIQHIEEDNASQVDRLSINLIVNYIFNQVHSETYVRIKTINMNFHSLNLEDQKRYSTRYTLAADSYVNVNANVWGFVASGIFYPTQIDYKFE